MLKMSFTTEALKFMSKEQLDVRNQRAAWCKDGSEFENAI